MKGKGRRGATSSSATRKGRGSLEGGFKKHFQRDMNG